MSDKPSVFLHYFCFKCKLTIVVGDQINACGKCGGATTVGYLRSTTNAG